MDFTIESFQNPYLPAGANRIDAVLTITSGNGGVAKENAVEAIIIDTSGSMRGDRIEAAKLGTQRALELLDEQAFFFLINFCSHAHLVCPMARATAANKEAAIAAVGRLQADGATNMSFALRLAREEFAKAPSAIHHALFLTDGKNGEDDARRLVSELEQCAGVFQCDCRGVGTDWEPKQLQQIAQTLLGTAAIIPEPAALEADFRATIQNALNRAVKNVRVRLWTPKTAKVVAFKQMSPEILVLSDRATQIDAQSRDYPTGAWAAESRDYYVALEMAPGEVGDEMLAARAMIVYESGGQEVKSPQTRILASWTGDEALSARINDHVAHYTGQEELAQCIQKGLEERDKGNAEAATHMLGKAAKLAAASGNEDTTRRLSKVVDIVDAEHGTVRLKKSVNKADEMDLDLCSTRTAKARR